MKWQDKFFDLRRPPTQSRFDANDCVSFGLNEIGNQLSMEETSPPSIEPTDCQTASATLLETNPTDPSHLAVFTPPVWRLQAALRCVFDALAVAAGMAGSPVT